MERTLVSIVMGSDSDLPVMKEAGEILDIFGISYEIDIVSAHRTPEKLYEFASTAHHKGIGLGAINLTNAWWSSCCYSCSQWG